MDKQKRQGWLHLCIVRGHPGGLYEVHCLYVGFRSVSCIYIIYICNPCQLYQLDAWAYSARLIIACH